MTIGVAVGVALAAAQHVPLREAAQLAVTAGLWALVPDIDHPHSMISGIVPGARLVSIFTRHRGPTHSVVFVAAALLAVLAGHLRAGVELPELFLLAIGGGLASHILSDMLTPTGCPLMWPYGFMYKFAPGRVLKLTKWAGLEQLVWVGSLLCILFCGAQIMGIHQR